MYGIRLEGHGKTVWQWVYTHLMVCVTSSVMANYNLVWVAVQVDYAARLAGMRRVWLARKRPAGRPAGKGQIGRAQGCVHL